MHVQKLKACAEFMADDGTQLRELLHPDKQQLKLRYSLAHATVQSGHTSVLHSLITSEVYYILSGTGEMHIDDQKEFVEAGDTIYIPPNAKQYIHNSGTEPLIFICIVEAARKVTNQPIPVTLAERRPGDPPILVGSGEKAKRILGWQPQYTDLQTIIEHAWRWHQNRHGKATN